MMRWASTLLVMTGCSLIDPPRAPTPTRPGVCSAVSPAADTIVATSTIALGLAVQLSYDGPDGSAGLLTIPLFTLGALAAASGTYGFVRLGRCR